MTQHYPADISPAPAVCYSVEKLTAGFVGGSPIVVQKIGSLTQAAIGFAGDVLDQSALSTFLTGEAYGRVVRFNNQMFSIGDAIAPTLGRRRHFIRISKSAPRRACSSRAGRKSDRFSGSISRRRFNRSG
jgi:hypothetical protein